MIQHPERLIEALQILDCKREQITVFYNSILSLEVQADGIDRFRDAFRASISERRGASFKRGEVAFQEFDNRINELIEKVNLQIKHNPEQAHRTLFETIIMIPNVNQKIVSMFIKFLVVYLDIWHKMLPFLYVPLDRVVLKILGKKLQVYVGKRTAYPSISKKLYVRGNRMSVQYDRFIEFQNELREIARQAGVQRILVDELWFIGHIFCKEYPLCHRCWIRKICQGSPFN